MKPFNRHVVISQKEDKTGETVYPPLDLRLFSMQTYKMPFASLPPLPSSIAAHPFGFSCCYRKRIQRKGAKGREAEGKLGLVRER